MKEYLDQENELNKNLQEKCCAITFGNVVNDCSLHFYLDEVKYYNTAIEDFELKSLAKPFVPAFWDQYFTLGCLNCEIQEAIDACENTNHVCTDIELQAGAALFAKTMGFTSQIDDIWSFNDIKRYEKGEIDDEGFKNTAICCKDS